MTRELDITKALRHFGLGAAPVCETCFVAAAMVRETPTVIICDVQPVPPNRFAKRLEFLRSEINYEFYSANSVLLELPKTYLPIFLLWAYELPEAIMRPIRDRVTMHSAPYLKPPDRPLERIGTVRI